MPAFGAFFVSWNFPNPEKAKHVVYAVSVEVLCHYGKSFFPPVKVVFSHFIPIISRETPVLTIFGEVIGWGAGRHVTVE